MRLIYLCLLVLLSCHIMAQAQSDSLLIMLKNNQVEKIAISQIQKLKFENLTDVNETQPDIKNLQLGGNYPNPFIEQTNIEFDIAAPGLVEVTIYDNSGKQIRTLKCESCLPGTNTLRWNCMDKNNNRVPNGSYYYEVRFDNEIQSKKMIVMK